MKKYYRIEMSGGLHGGWTKVVDIPQYSHPENVKRMLNDMREDHKNVYHFRALLIEELDW